ncbi:acyl-CoA synthetase [Streptomyces tateyamensis]|uniref:Acyl-CoA synthetase n=1 Tax=Streptomyces tateyamensis TaxID=565073 RepID=A0A2V4MU41_9ACTN|nr:amino acid adenylation domain-containing protein [Streptomyces tateyamensis]PYC68196.1 acyl-CoA synthetase [Streptomyces tateyamensis]
MSNHDGITPDASDLLDAFTEGVRQFPERPAVRHHGQELSYQQLAERVAAAAMRIGHHPGTVAVWTDRTPNTVVALLAVLAAGGAYCPIDPAFPAERQAALLAAAGCTAAIGAPATTAAALGLTVLDLTDPAPNPAAAASPAAVAAPAATATAAPAAAAAAAPEDPAYLLFTSGSTGTPKPVLTPRRAISTTVAALRALFALTPEDRVLQFASLNWDTCFEEILPTLTAGAALVLDQDAHSGSFPRFLRLVARERVTVLDLPTAFWHELVRHLTDQGEQLPSCLRLVVIGGEAVSPAALADWHALDTARIRLLNTYGCTETTLITHAAELLPGRVGAPLGRPLPHVRELVTEEGELLIGGPALALGYRELAQATAERFTTPAGRTGRWFRTGDRVGRDAAGLLVHQGRLDHQLKVRGIRVDPAEVEAHLTAHPEVGAAAVTGATLAGRSALVAYVVPRRGNADPQTLRTALRAHLRSRVPDHLVPSRITVVAELAHTASGKVDRAATHRRHTVPTQESEQP